jgi:hypothetical protein
MLNVVMLCVVMLCVVMLNVVATVFLPIKKNLTVLSMLVRINTYAFFSRDSSSINIKLKFRDKLVCASIISFLALSYIKINVP